MHIALLVWSSFPVLACSDSILQCQTQTETLPVSQLPLATSTPDTATPAIAPLVQVHPVVPTTMDVSASVPLPADGGGQTTAPIPNRTPSWVVPVVLPNQLTSTETAPNIPYTAPSPLPHSQNQNIANTALEFVNKHTEEIVEVKRRLQKAESLLEEEKKEQRHSKEIIDNLNLSLEAERKK